MKIVSLKSEEFLQKVNNFSTISHLPSLDDLLSLCLSASVLLDNEDSSYRPAIEGADGIPGGFLDFTKKSALPLIVVPDIHARRFFLSNILSFTLPKNLFSDLSQNSESLTVLDALEKQLLRIVFVGDFLHAESRARERWFSAMEDFENNNFTGSSITEEMTEGLNTLMILWALKSRYPHLVHLLKGNHENITNTLGNGNFPFKKFANEGEIVRFFMQEKYGEKALECISSFESLLPVAAAFPRCFISHAEPRRFYTRYELVSSPLIEEVIYGLTWTPNNEAKEGSVAQMLKTFVPESDSVYFAGHRSVEENYALRQNGKLIQIHNPKRQNISLVFTDKAFNPETDIYSVEK